MTFDEWWDNERARIYQDRNSHEAAQAAWDAALSQRGDVPSGDSKRLDWLEAHRASIYKSTTGMKVGHWVVVDETIRDRRGNVANTLREAIDQAMPQGNSSERK